MAEPVDAALRRRLIGLLDLTSLAGDETAAAIAELCARAVRHGTAAVCVPPHAVAIARARLAGTPVRLATVAGFPAGGDDLAAVAEEVAAAVAAGADEIDVVAPLAAIADGDIGLAGELVRLVKATAGPATVTKLILETGTLGGAGTIASVARAAVMEGVDFLKTSTGKVAVGATPEAVAVLLQVIVEAGGRVGLKVAGGVRTKAQAAAYLAQAEAALGPGWAGPARFRIGASRLLDELAGGPAAPGAT
jgi:deoxyribose-phosphate aldolase